MATLMLAPDTQLAFNSKKGSVPVRLDLDVSGMDACAQKGMASAAGSRQADPEHQLPDLARSGRCDRGRDHAILEHTGDDRRRVRRQVRRRHAGRRLATAATARDLRRGRSDPAGRSASWRPSRSRRRVPSAAASRAGMRRRRLALLPTAIVVLVVYLGCMLWTVRLSFQLASCCPSSTGSACSNITACSRTTGSLISVENIAIFGVLFVVGALVLGFLLAVFIDQQVRAEGVFRTVFLYPYAMSFIVTGLDLAMVSQPDLGPAEAGARHRLHELYLRLARQPGAGDLHAGDRRAVAGLRAGHGDPAGGPARHRRRPVEGRQDRRHPDLAGLSLDRPAAARADDRHRHRPARERRWPSSTTSSSP